MQHNVAKTTVACNATDCQYSKNMAVKPANARANLGVVSMLG